MSSFQLPPMLGFDPTLRSKLAVPNLMGAEGGMQGPEAIGKAARKVDEAEGDSTGFGDVLADTLGQMRSLQNDVQEKTRAFAMGEGVELHDVMIAADKSEVTFNLMLEVRNKLVDAWEKLSRSAV